MSVLTYESRALQWRPGSDGDRNFAVVIFAVVVLSVSLGIVLSLITVPKEPRQVRVAVPERIAKFILDKDRPKPQPKAEVLPLPKPRPEIKVDLPPEPEPEPKSKPDETEIEPVPQVKPQKPERTEVLTDAQQRARASAEKSGLLALGNELSDLIDTSDVSKMARTKITNMSGTSTAAAAVDTGILSANRTGGGSAANVKAGDYSASISSTPLNQQERLKVASTLMSEKSELKNSASGTQSGTKPHKSSAGSGVRFEEDIYYVIDQNKGKLHAVYRQARRANPGLKGKIIFDITILASGQVSAVIIRSSELNDPVLEERLVSRIKSFDFGAREGGEMTVTYPVEFIP